MNVSAFKSKSVWGAIIFLISSIFLSQYGFEYVAETNTVLIHLDDLMAKISVGGGVLGFVMQIYGRLTAKGPIKLGW